MSFTFVTGEYASGEIEKHPALANGVSSEVKRAVLGIFALTRGGIRCIEHHIDRLKNLLKKHPTGLFYIKEALVPQPEIVEALIKLSLEQGTVEKAEQVALYLQTI